MITVRHVLQIIPCFDTNLYETKWEQFKDYLAIQPMRRFAYITYMLKAIMQLKK